LVQCEAVERRLLQPLQGAPYDLAIWKVVKLHRDCYVVFDNAFYSAPFRLIGQQLQVRGGSREVRIYTAAFELVATHPRAQQPGERLTHPHHLPPEKLPGLLIGKEACQAVADDIGPATRHVLDAILGDSVVDRRRSALRLLAFRERYGDDRLEAACGRALRFDTPTYATVKRILQEDLDREALPTPAPFAPARTFVRSAGELLGHLFGGNSWT
jgi:hypothetical protein